MRYLYYLLLFLSPAVASAQSNLQIRVNDAETQEGLFGANIALFQKNTFINGTSTDFDGRALLSNIDPGWYRIEVTYTGMQMHRNDSLQVHAERLTYLTVALTPGEGLSEFQVIEYQVPLIEQDCITTGGTVTSAQITNLPTKNINAPAATTAGLAPAPGTNVAAKGARSSATDYYIDGVRVRGSLIPQSEIAALVEETDAFAQPERPTAGQLTAGHWRDIDNKDFWAAMLAEDFDQWKRHWQLFPEQVIELELVNRAQRPLIDAEVRLYDRQTGALLWEARTDNTGRAALWTDPTQPHAQVLPVRAEVTFAGRTYPLKLKARTGHRRERLVVPAACAAAPVIDLAFAVDISGSMGDELRFLQSELTDVIERVGREHADKTVRTAAIAYRSPGDAYVTKVSPFTRDPLMTTAFFRATQASGGSGGAEAVELAFERALELDWSAQAVARILFILLDEPPEHDQLRQEKLQRYSRDMARRGIKVVPVVSSGAKRDLEYLMRAVSVLTNGTYTFLTDHSGIGNAHLEPAVDSYDVFQLNDLLVKIVNDFAAYDGCTKLAVAQAVGEQPTVRVHPNPVTEILYLDGNDTNDTPLSARLLDATGRELRSRVVDATQFNVSDLAPGVYFVEVQQGKRAWVERVIVER